MHQNQNSVLVLHVNANALTVFCIGREVNLDRQSSNRSIEEIRKPGGSFQYLQIDLGKKLTL